MAQNDRNYDTFPKCHRKAITHADTIMGDNGLNLRSGRKYSRGPIHPKFTVSVLNYSQHSCNYFFLKNELQRKL